MSATLLLVQKVFHFATVLYYVAVVIVVFAGMEHAHERLGRPKDDPLVNRMLQGSATYFTAWNLVIQQLYFVLCCTEHTLEMFPKALSRRTQKLLNSMRRMMLPVLLFPCSFEVVFNFWTVYSYSPRMVFGDFLDIINPIWVNHAIHTFILPITVMEMYLRSHTEGIWDGGFLNDVLKLSALFTVYLLTVLVGYIRRGTWPYPFMDFMGIKMFIGFVFLCFAMGWTWFSIGRFLSGKLCALAGKRRLNHIDSTLKVK